MNKIRQRLITRYAFSFENELGQIEWKNLYNDRFLHRMGEKSEIPQRLVNRAIVVMILFDVLLLLILSGVEVKVKLMGNEIASFVGIVEIGVSLASLAFLYSVYQFINYQAYKAIIKAALRKRNEKSIPEFYMGSLISIDYVWEVLAPKMQGLQSGAIHAVAAVILAIVLLSLSLGMYALHVVAVYLCSIHILSTGALGPLASKFLFAALMLINVGGLVIFLTACVYPFKFHDDLLNTKAK